MKWGCWKILGLTYFPKSDLTFFFFFLSFLDRPRSSKLLLVDMLEVCTNDMSKHTALQSIYRYCFSSTALTIANFFWVVKKKNVTGEQLINSNDINLIIVLVYDCECENDLFFFFFVWLLVDRINYAQIDTNG